MSEIDQDAPHPPPKRAQFPLWFLLFVLPTVAGLGSAIYANWQKQAQTGADLAAQQAILREKIAMLQSEIALAQQVHSQVRAQANRWKTPESVVAYLQRYYQDIEAHEHGFYEVPLSHRISCFYVQADEQDLRRLLILLREAYPKCDSTNQYSLLDVAVKMPVYAPDKVDRLAGEARRLAEVVPNDSHPRIRQQVDKLLAAFHLDEPSPQPEDVP